MRKQAVLQRFVSIQCLAALLYLVIYDEDLISSPHWFVSMIDWPWWVAWSLVIWVAQFWSALKLSTLGRKAWQKFLAGLIGPLTFGVMVELAGRIEGYAPSPDTPFDTFLSYVFWFAYCQLFFAPAWIGLFLPRSKRKHRQEGRSPQPVTSV